MGAVQGAGLAAEKAFIEIVCISQIEIADLRSVEAGNAEKLSGLDRKAGGITRRDSHLVDQFYALTRNSIGVKVERRKGVDG